MARPCRLCEHPDREALETALLRKEKTQEDVAKILGVTRKAIGQHIQGHVPEAVRLAISSGKVTQDGLNMTQMETREDDDRRLFFLRRLLYIWDYGGTPRSWHDISMLRRLFAHPGYRQALLEIVNSRPPEAEIKKVLPKSFVTSTQYTQYVDRNRIRITEAGKRAFEEQFRKNRLTEYHDQAKKRLEALGLKDAEPGLVFIEDRIEGELMNLRGPAPTPVQIASTLSKLGLLPATKGVEEDSKPKISRRIGPCQGTSKKSVQRTAKLIVVKLSSDKLFIRGVNIIPGKTEAKVIPLLKRLANKHMENIRESVDPDRYGYTLPSSLCKEDLSDAYIVRTRLKRLQKVIKESVPGIAKNSVIEFIKHRGFRFNPHQVHLILVGDLSPRKVP